MQRRKYMIVFLAIAALALSACARAPSTTAPGMTTPPTSTAPTSKPAETTATVAVPHGDLKIVVSSFADERFNPPRTSTTVIMNVLGPMFEYLFRYDKKVLEAWLLDKWEIAPDGLSYTFYVRKNIKFHNGDTMTAKDVKFSLEQYASPDAFYTDLRRMIDRIELIDDYTVRVYTQGPQPYFLYTLMTVAPNAGIVMPKDYIDRNGWDYFEKQPVGTNAFKFVKKVPGDMVLYEALTEHWRQVPEFKNLSVILVPEETTRVAMLKTSAADAIDIGLEATNELNAAGYKTFVMDIAYPTINLCGTYHPNAAGMPLADIRVRKALSLAINRDEIGRTFFYGTMGPAMPPFVSDEDADIDVQYWMDYAKEVFRYDPEEAKRLLNEAGYPQGFTMKLYSSAIRGAPYLPKLAEISQGFWEKIGVKAQVIPTDWSIVQSWRTGPKPELMGAAFMYRYSVYPMSNRSLDSGYSSKGSYTLFSTAKPDVDKLIADSMTETDPAKRKELIDKAAKIVADSYTSLVFGSAPSMGALGSRVSAELPPKARSISVYADIMKHK